jgi:hypothetical protein
MVDPSMVSMVVDVCCCTEAKARKALELSDDPSAAIELVLGGDPRLEVAAPAAPAPAAAAAAAGATSWESLPPGPERAAARAAPRKAERAAAAASGGGAGIVKQQPRAARPVSEPEPEPEPEPLLAAAPAPAPGGGGYYIKSKKDEDDTFVVPKKKQVQQPKKLQAVANKDEEKGTHVASSSVSLARSGGIARRGENRQKKGGVDFKTSNLRVSDPSKLLKKGRQMCLCQGMHHRLIGNCSGCGLIICEQIGLGPCLFCDGNGEPQPEYACGVQVEGSKEQLAQLQKERQSHRPAGTNPSRRQREDRRGRGGRGRGRAGGGGAAASSDEGVIIKGGRSSVNPDLKKGGAAAPAESADELAEKARKAKDKLLEFDRTTAKRTQVIDDQSDWYDASATTLMWLNDEERKKHEQEVINAEIKEREEREEARKVKLSFDFAGRKIMPRINAPEEELSKGGAEGDAEGEGKDGDEGVGTSAYGGGANNMMGGASGSSGGRSGNDAVDIMSGSQGGGGGSYSNPFLRGPKPAYAGIIAALPDADPDAHGVESKSSRSRVQDEDGSGTDLDYWRSNIDGAQMSTQNADEEDDVSKSKKRMQNVFGTVGGGSYSADMIFGGGKEETGPAMCLSMHQPWASLLIAGIKTVEGREWPTAHRGRLWIASTVQACDPTEAEEMRQEYEERVSRGEQEELPWPEHFPSSMLLGCIEVTDCIDQEEYRERCQRDELVDEGNGSSYLFVADNPMQLLVPLRVSGQHKIFKLPAKTAAMARAGLGSARSLKKGGGKKKKKIPIDASQAELDESDDIALALAASLEGGGTGSSQGRVAGDVGVVADLSRVDLLPKRPPPCAVSVLPHSTDDGSQQLTVEVLQEGMAVVRGFLSPREQQVRQRILCATLY